MNGARFINKSVLQYLAEWHSQVPLSYIPIPNMTPLAYQIANVLLPICLQETAKMREIYEKEPAIKLSPQCEKIKKLLDAYAHLTSNESASIIFKDILATILVDTNPELSKQLLALKLTHQLVIHKPIYNNFTVVVVIKDVTGHKLYLNVPRIVTHGKTGESLYYDGEANNSFNFGGVVGEARLATDEEIEACLNTLTAQQIKRIMTMDLFAPIVNPLFEEQTELVPVDEEPELKKPKDISFDWKETMSKENEEF